MSDSPAVKTITPVIYVDAVEPCLSFWTDRLGFQKVAEVPSPGGKTIQFAMLVKSELTVMYQTWAAFEEEAPELAREGRGRSITLFVVVEDIDATARAMEGVPVLVPRHHTFYGMDEFTVREPGGNIVTFAMRVS